VIEEFAIQSYPTEEYRWVVIHPHNYRWVVIHPHNGTLFFCTQEQRDQYAEDAAIDMGGDPSLSRLCCAEVDALFIPMTAVH
jgi:hypothetical protein